MDTEKIVLLKENISMLVRGVDPQTKTVITEDTVLSSRFNRTILSEVIILLDSLLNDEITFNHEPKDSDQRNRRQKREFHLSEMERDNIVLSDTAISVSEFTHKINAVLMSSKTKKLQATQITSWLKAQGYLAEEVHRDGKIFKVLTEKAKEIGMSSRAMENSAGRKYDVNLYSAQTQKFIIDNINQIVGK